MKTDKFLPFDDVVDSMEHAAAFAALFRRIHEALAPGVGSLLGRVRMAAADARPAPNAIHVPACVARTHAISHHAVAGTSLIGSNARKRKSGLQAKTTQATRAQPTLSELLLCVVKDVAHVISEKLPLHDAPFREESGRMTEQIHLGFGLALAVVEPDRADWFLKRSAVLMESIFTNRKKPSAKSNGKQRAVTAILVSNKTKSSNGVILQWKH